MSREAFFREIRPLFGGKFSQGQVDGIEHILAASSHLPVSYQAYLLATAFHETAGDMSPNRENMIYTSPSRIRAVWPSRFPTDASAQPYVRNERALANKVYNGRLGNRPGSDDGWLYRGGGQAHTTGRDNYAKVKRATGVDVLANPSKILDPKVSAVALVQASLEGWYTGKKLSDYLPGDYVNARRVINGTDKAAEIARHAVAFEKALLLIKDKPIEVKPGGGLAAFISRILSLLKRA